MRINRNPHLAFAAAWAVWLGCVYFALMSSETPAYGLIVLLAFFLIEIPATLYRSRANARDTLSEIATWLQRHSSKHQRFARGWNAALFAGLILPIAWLLMRTVVYYSGSLLLGVAMGAFCATFLWDHFVDPVTHG